MFALQVNFLDAAEPELIFVRRQQALIGGDESSHVVIDDLRALPYQIRIVRQLGRSFLVETVAKENSESAGPGIAGTYDGYAKLDVGPVSLHVMTLDVDLTVKEGEALDKTSVRVLRAAMSHSIPRLPALVLRGSHLCVISLVEDQPYIVGRSRAASIRLESADISAKHAKIWFENDSFWVEDLGSTNGTFVNGQRITGKVQVGPMCPILLGREVGLFGIVNEQSLNEFREGTAPATPVKSLNSSYPCLVSMSSVVRPSRLPLNEGEKLRVGRETHCDVWLGAPHVSRQHCTIVFDDSTVVIEDTSTNGTGYDDGLLRKAEIIKSNGRPYVLNFGAGVTLALCFTAEHEQTFREKSGSPTSFSSSSTRNDDRPSDSENSASVNARGTVYQPMQAIARRSSVSHMDVLMSMYHELPRASRFLLVLLAVGALTLIAAIVALLLSAWIL